MRDEERLSPLEALAEAMFFLFILAIPIGMFALKFQQAQTMATELSQELSTEKGHIFGTIEEIETWEEGDYKSKVGGMTLTLQIKDRTRFTFKDGRSKEVLGIPETEVPKDKEVAVTWAAHGVLREVIDAEEYRSREGDGN